MQTHMADGKYMCHVYIAHTRCMCLYEFMHTYVYRCVYIYGVANLFHRCLGLLHFLLARTSSKE
jgi:hypothetical protein